MTGLESSGHRSGPVRSSDARRAILDATAQEFLAKGYQGLTIQGIAALAGVGKQTIYRWWTSKAQLLSDCLLEGLLWDSAMTLADTRDVVHDVSDWMARMLDVDHPGSRDVVRSLLGAATTDQALAQQLDEVLRGQHEGGVSHRLLLAQSRSEIPADLDIVPAADLLIGLVVVRTITGRGTSRAELDAVVRQLLTRG